MNNLTSSILGNLSSFSTSPNVTTASVGVTMVEFWVVLIVFMGLANGCIGTIGNTAIAIGILRSKKLRTRFFIIICYLAISRIITGAQSMVVVVYRTLRTLNYVPMNMSRGLCYLLQFQVYYMGSLEMVLLLALVVDRTLAVVAYKYYRRLTYQQANTGCAAITLVTVTVKLIPSLLWVNFGETIPCVNSVSPTSKAYTFYTQYVDVAAAVVILVVYIYLIIYVRFRFASLVAKGTGQEGDQARKISALKQHTKLIPILTRLVWLHVGLTLNTKIVMSTQQWFPPQIAIRIATYAAALTSTDVVANTVVLLIGNNDLKQACFPCCGSAAQSVAPEPTSTMLAAQGSQTRNSLRRARVVQVQNMQIR